MKDDTRQVVTRAVPRIVERLGSAGVTGAHWFLGFGGEPVIWLVTESDGAKQRVALAGFFEDSVREVLREAGLPESLAARAVVTVESEETVARDFGGNWWHAMK